jgi:hypothetical protein
LSDIGVETQYEIRVYTGALPQAGTKANVFITLFGDGMCE